MQGIASADFIEGAAKAFAVLESFSAERQRLNTTQAAQRAGITRAAARRHLLTLQHLGYVQGEGGFYWLAPRVLRLAGNYLSSARLPRAVQPTLNRLAADTGQAFSVAVLDGAEVVIVARSGEHRNSSTVLPYGVHLGARLPAFATSTGRVLLAQLAAADLRRWMLNAQIKALTALTVKNKTSLRQEIQKVQQQGFCAAADEHELGVRALAVPLRDSAGQVVAALNIVQTFSDKNSVLPNKDGREQLQKRYCALLLQAASEMRSLL